MTSDREPVEDITGSAIAEQTYLPGGDISGASLATLADGRRVVIKRGPMVEAEGRMLRAMAETGAPVPAVYGWQSHCLVMEHIESGAIDTHDRWHALAETLLCLTGSNADAFGWSEDYALKDVNVSNTRSGNWAHFWRKNRLLCHLPHLDPELARRVEALAEHMEDLLPSAPDMALVHGDLWAGNIVHANDGRAVLIDPCAYIGHREVDVASLTVFDNPPPSFFDALQLEHGWQARQPIYRLWMWLVHVRLFGASYRSAVTRDLDLLGF